MPPALNRAIGSRVPAEAPWNQVRLRDDVQRACTLRAQRRELRARARAADVEEVRRAGVRAPACAKFPSLN